MRNYITLAVAGLITSTALLGASPAMAHGRVDWSVSIGAPIYYGPPVVYAPPPVYYAPPPVVYAPPPAVYINGPVVYGPPGYVYPAGYWRGRPWHGHHGHHGHHRR
ncbi:hypothetical protein [Undibacterium sp.]|uniref:hypothetical protein n=1 Tax=Undibacterium sp. TaxID=1914977 RepID=UPI002B782016|nr:hypothetical protein [Undibacterium sp.]HTD03969.1 hypothetical protein [Undibacterium sp.]